MAANDALPFFEAEAKKRQLAALKQGNKKPDKALMPEREPQARDQAGALLGVSGRYVSDAKEGESEWKPC